MEFEIPIFIAGEYPGKMPVSVEDLDTVVADYDPAKYNAPLCFGHPEFDSPAWGWVTGLRRTGELLYAKLKGISPWVKDVVNKGMFQYVSARFFPPEESPTKKIHLRHVGMLGAYDPAVHGLEGMKFNQLNPEEIQSRINAAASAGESFCFQFSQGGGLSFYSGKVEPDQGKKDEEEKQMKERLIKLLGLKEDADETAIFSAIQGTLDAGKAGTEFTAELSKVLGFSEPPKESKEIIGRIHELKMDGATFDKTQFSSLQDRVGKMEAEKLVDKYEAEGKIVPAIREEALSFAASDPARFQKYMEKAPKIAPDPGSVQDRSDGPEKNQSSESQKSWFAAAGFEEGKAEELLGWKKPEKKPEKQAAQQ